jgi:formate C-acetyltransferase
MRPQYGDDYAIACCVSAMRIGKQMQFFGARVNLAKTLLYAINGGKDEKSGDQIAPQFPPITTEYLDYDEVRARFQEMMAWLAKTYINTLNVIHYMHDKYCYERLEMALHDRDVYRTMACGIAGLSVVADSLSAIKHAKVKVIRNEQGLAVDYSIEGEFPKYGNNDDRADSLAIELVQSFMNEIRQHKTYRGAVATQSVLTITSNVVYGKKTGSTPDGRKAGEPFAPGANPMHGRDSCGAIASLSSLTLFDLKVRGFLFHRDSNEFTLRKHHRRYALRLQVPEWRLFERLQHLCLLYNRNLSKHEYVLKVLFCLFQLRNLGRFGLFYDCLLFGNRHYA